MLFFSVFIQLKQQAFCFLQFLRHTLNIFLKITADTLINLTHIFVCAIISVCNFSFSF